MASPHRLAGRSARRALLALIAVATMLVVACAPATANRSAGENPPQEPLDILAHTVIDIHGEPIALETFRGQVVMIVNTASECGFTSQYADLQEIHEVYGERGFTVLGFPCNDFGGQEPGTNEEIAAFCTGEFGVTFPMMARVNIKRDAHPLFRDLQERTADGIRGPVRWNFTKFLVDREGQVVHRWGSRVRPNAPEVTAAIEALL